MKGVKKIASQAILAALSMTLVAMIGCSKQGAEPQAAPAPGSGSAGEKVKENALPEAKLIWYLRGSKPKNADTIVAKANEITKAKINATVEYRFVEPGDYDQKLQLAMASGEPYDIAWASNWSNNYVENVNKGAYLALDDYFPAFPKLKQSMPEKVWNGVKVNGKIYGVFNYQILSLPAGFMFKKELIDKYKIDLNQIRRMSDLTPVFELIKQKEPGVVPLKYGVPNVGQVEAMGHLSNVEKFIIDTKTWKVGDYLWASDSMMPHYKLMREWYSKGFFPSNVATAAEGDPALAKAGKLFSEYANYKPGVEAELAAKLGYEVAVKQFNEPPMVATLYSTLNAISRTSKNPERALMLLELMNTDKDLYNLMTFGIEGQDYRKTGSNRIEKIAETYQFDAWQLGNQFNAYLLAGQPDDAWEQTKKMNEGVTVDPIADFSFNRTPVQNELVQISAIFKEFNVILKNGLDDPDAAVKRFRDKLKQAGEEKVKAEIQKQLDEWRKTK